MHPEEAASKTAEHNRAALEAERAVLGAILADNTLLPAVGELVNVDDFSSPAHGNIYSSMLRLDGKSRAVDHLTLSEDLKEQGHLIAVGGPAYLMRLDQVVPLAANAVEYARIVKSQAARRRLAEAGRAIVTMAEGEIGDLDEVYSEAERRVFALGEKRHAGDLLPMSDLLEGTLDKLDQAKQNGNGVTGLATGYYELDLLLTGLHPGELIILAARPGIGKTSFALNIAAHAALKKGAGVGIFSLEMPSHQLITRLIASEARVDMKRLRGGRLNAHDEERIQETAGQLYSAPIYIDDSGGLSPLELRSKGRRLKAKDPKLGLIVVDYLQLMEVKSAESRQQEVSEISRQLKKIAKELEVPIIALSQLSRKVEERKKGKPMLSDLRESGSIEQDADVVLFIHREEKDDEKEEGDDSPRSPVVPVELVIAKQRNGPIGDVPLVFMTEHTRFENPARSA